MRFFTAAAVAISALVSSVAAQAVSGGANPIRAPLGDVALEAGKPFTIKWDNDFGSKVTLNLRKGSDTNDLDNILTIAADISNSGEYTWTPPAQLEGADDYAIEIIADGSANYSHQFEVESDGPGITASKTATASATSTASKSSASASATSASASKSSASASASASASESASASSEPSATAEETADASSTPITPPSAADSAAGQLSSPLALVLCIVAGLVYFH